MRLIAPTRRRFLALFGAGAAALLGPGRSRAGEAKVHEVMIKRFEFEPADLTIAPGDCIRWTNLDAAPHTATGLDGAWDTGRLRRNDSGEITFETEGEHAYLCTYHPAMRGTVTVRAES